MTMIEQHLLRMITGDATVTHRDAALPALLAELRSAANDPRALQLLGLFAMAQVNASLKSSIQAEKALLRAKGGAR